MSMYRSPEVEDHPLDWVDINHPLNRVSLPFYNLGLQIHRRRGLIAALAAALVAITIPALIFLTVAHVPSWHWVPKFMRLSWDQKEVCFTEVGCFSNDPPFHLLPLPWQPEAVNVNLYLVSKNGSYHGIPLGNHDDFPTSLFDRKADTKLFIHGQSTRRDAKCVRNIVHSIHHNKDSTKYNVIVVDWFEGSRHLWQYYHAVSNTRLVGAIVANWLLQMTNDHQYSLENVHCIGHSLGAHTCGFVGNKFPLGRITGLDPAGIVFGDMPLEGRLDRADAAFVDVIHTDVGPLGVGYEEPMGHVDFYPNGGSSQIGCNWENKNISLWRLIICNHMMSIDYLAHGYLNDVVPKAIPCQNLSAARQGKCPSDGVSDFLEIGENTKQFSREGIYYLNISVLPSQFVW